MNIRSISRLGHLQRPAREGPGPLLHRARCASWPGTRTSRWRSSRGGNQQKVVLSKCINADSRILLMDEPTRGIDVGAKEEIHNLIRELARGGHVGDRVLLRAAGGPEPLRQDHAAVRGAHPGRDHATAAEVDSERIMHIVTGAEEALTCHENAPRRPAEAGPAGHPLFWSAIVFTILNPRFIRGTNLMYVLDPELLRHHRRLRRDPADDLRDRSTSRSAAPSCLAGMVHACFARAGVPVGALLPDRPRGGPRWWA